VKEIQPDFVVAVDALASRRLSRVCTAIQISDTGIIPGSGVGNHRMALNRRTLGVPVFSVGVPTVVEAATLAADLLEESGITDFDEKRLRGKHKSMMVTTRDVDAQVRDLAKVIGYGLNWALQDLEIEEINALLS
jgi:spore protease